MAHDDSLDDLLREELGDVQPLSERDRRVVARRRRRAPDGREAGSAPGRFSIERWGDHVEGLREGVDSARLDPARHGDVSPDVQVDLHGMDEEGARDLVLASMRRAVRGGARAVLVVHGRGRHSPDGPVLKEALPGWLARPPHGPRVLGFTTAGPHGGGGGATLVLLDGGRRRGR